MTFIARSLNTKLLFIVLLFTGAGSVLFAWRQSHLELVRLEQAYDVRLQRLVNRYQSVMSAEIGQRQRLLQAARTTLFDTLQEQRDQSVPETFQLPRSADGGYRHYDGRSGVFVHRDTPITPALRKLAYDTAPLWEHWALVFGTHFDALYLISTERLTRIWPRFFVEQHDPEHDVTQDIFFTFASPENNPERGPRWTPIYFDAYTHVWMITLALPLYDGNHFWGVLGADLDMSFLFERLAELDIDDDGIQAFVFDDNGNLILDSRQSRDALPTQEGDYALLNLREEMRPDVGAFIQGVLSGDYSTDRVYHLNLYDKPQQVVARSLDDMNWYFALHYPRANVLASRDQLMSAVYANTLMMGLLFAVVLYFSLRWFVTRRISRLARATAKVNISQWREYVPEDGVDEISRMGRSINAMLDKINDLFRGLNDNILRMERLAYYDQLTGLENRTQFKNQLRKALRTCERDKHHLALLYLDLDHFKRINDTLGHEAGDVLLVEVAQRLKQCLREDDSVGRLGGDEFAVLLQRVDSAQYAFVVASKIIDALNKPIELLGQEVVVGVSIGITMAPDDSRDSDVLMKNADLAMYQAKDRGRNALQFYTPDMNSAVEQRLHMERELRAALNEHRLTLHYQPQVDLRTGELVGVEALMRWQHPDKGMISPEVFIPVAEDSGLIVPMGRWALHQACQQARAFHKALGRPLRVSVNVSARQLRDDFFMRDLEHALSAGELDAQWLELEITESVLMAEGDQAIGRLRELRERGVQLAIDDFGTGYSSLSYLKRMPVTRLKIDRSFVQDLPDDEEDRAITSLIVAMANSLYYEVVVEGIETEAQLHFLARCGCDYAQGFYFSRPLPADELLALAYHWQPDPQLQRIFG